jgi:hypothetical protein
MCPHVSQWRILANPSSAISLDSTVQCIEQGLGYKNLGLSNFLAGSSGVGVIDADRGIQDNQTSSVNLNARLGDTLQLDLVFGELDAEGLLARVVNASNEVVESFLGLEIISIGAYGLLRLLLTDPMDLMA